jgi:GDPmannose 4,6-dehydratase
MRIARGVAAKALRRTDMPLTLAGVDMARDWGHSRDYVRGMWMMLQQGEPHDMVLATGRLHTVKQFVEMAFAHIGVRAQWLYASNGEVIGATDGPDGETILRIDQTLRRPVEVTYLLGDSSFATRHMGWKPTISFEVCSSRLLPVPHAGC